MQLQFHTADLSIQSSVAAFLEEWRSTNNSFEVKTSGSTGAPKTISILKNYARSSAKMTGNYLNLRANQNALLCLSPDTIAGKMMIIRAVELGLNLHVTAPSSCPLEGITEKMNFVAMVPYQVQQSIKSTPASFHPNMKLIIGGGPISTDLENQVQSLSCESYHTFGMTETISHFAMRTISKKHKAFQLLEGITASIVNDQLQISAPHLGVYNLKTNDSVELVSENAFIWKGRLDFVINSGGVKIHPEEVEKRLSSFIESPYFIIGEPDEQLGEVVVLCIESAPFSISKTKLDELLPKYHTPKKVYFYKEFEYTKSNKINRLATIKKNYQNEKSLL